MKRLNLKKGLKQLLLLVAALIVAAPAVPAFAQPDRDRAREEHRQQYQRREPERRDHERPERYERDSREHRDYRFAYREPHVFGPSCYTQSGYWAWDGWQHVWVPPQTVCD